MRTLKSIDDCRQLLTRRELFECGSVAAATFCVGNATWADSQTEIDIIDCHTHFYDPERTEGVPWPTKGTALYRTVLPIHLRKQKQYRRVTGTVIVEASEWVEDNHWLLELAKDDPFIVGIIGNLNPTHQDFEKHLKRFASNPLFRGIRASSGVVKRMIENHSTGSLKSLMDRNLTLDINGGPDSPFVVASLAKELPHLTIVQNHIGNVHITNANPPGDWIAAIEDAAEKPNTFCKISALVEGASQSGGKAPDQLEFYKPYIDVVWNAFGDDRVIYGSNWPVSELAADYYTLQRLVMEYVEAKGESATKKFCSENAKKAYKWIDREGRR